MAKKENTLTPDKISLFKDQDTVMNRIMQTMKAEVEALQGQREALIMKIAQLNDDVVRKQSQFEQWKRGEEQKMADMKNKLNNEIIRKEKAIEVGELDLSRRNEECLRREALGKVVIEKQAKLNSDRIEVEKLRSAASLLRDDAERKMSNALSVESQVNIKMAKVKEIEDKSNSINLSITKREETVIEKEKEIASATKNLEELKLLVEPKMTEIKEREEKIEKDKKFILDKEREVESKISEEKVILRDLDMMKKRLDGRSKELDQREEEMTRKALIAGINGK